MSKIMKVIGMKTAMAMGKAYRLKRYVVTCGKCVHHQPTGRCDWLDRFTSDTNYCCWGHPTQEEQKSIEQDEKEFWEIKAREDKEIMLGLDSPLDDYIKTVETAVKHCDEAIEMLKELNHQPELEHVTKEWVDSKFTGEDDEE